MTLKLGIDIGTSGVRTAVVEDERLVSAARAHHPPQKSDHVDANDWWDAVSMCLQRQAEELRQLGRDIADVSAIAVDGTSGSMVMTDAALAPVGPALMYNSKGFDAEAARIAKVAPTAHITLGSNSALARAMRLAAVCDRTPMHLLHQADFIASKLLGRAGSSDYNNALKTGYDPECQSWPDWIGQVIDPSVLPLVQASGAQLGQISATVAQSFGFGKGAVVHAGTTDSIAAFLACAPLEEGAAVTSLGSTLAVKLLSRTRVDDPSIGLYSHRLGDFWLVGGASNTGGAVLKSFFSSEQLADLSTRIDTRHPTGLAYYPLLQPGERFPINDPNLPPKLEPRPETDERFLQAMLEGMAEIEGRCYREIALRGGTAPKVLYTAGGGAANPVWTKLRGEAIGIAPITSEQTEASFGVTKLI